MYYKFTEYHPTPGPPHTEPIHELTQHTTMSQTKALQNVSARNYIVGSIDTYGRWSFSGEPAFHGTETEAKREADRLARITPGKAYVYVKLAGALVTSQVTEF